MKNQFTKPAWAIIAMGLILATMAIQPAGATPPLSPSLSPEPTATLLPFPYKFFVKVEVTRGCIEELNVTLPETQHVYPWFGMATENCDGSRWIIGQSVERGANQVYLTLVETTLAYLNGADVSVFNVFYPADFYEPYVEVLAAVRRSPDTPLGHLYFPLMAKSGSAEVFD